MTARGRAKPTTMVEGIPVDKLARAATHADRRADLERRALAAYFRSGGTEAPVRVTPQVQEYGGKLYVLIRVADQGLAVAYRVRADGMLRRLVRPPKALRG